MLDALRNMTRAKPKGQAHEGSDSDPEKHYPHEKAADGTHLYDEDLPLVPALEHTTEAKLLAKIDWRVVPVLTILYLMAFLDRVNIANAQVFGLSKDLNLKSSPNGATNEYNTALVIFFVPYCFFEIPANILLKKLRPHVWLSGCMLGFGAVTIGQGFVRSYSGLLATRFFLGLLESGMFPGCFYLISMWYRREQAQRRMTFFFSSATLAGAFGGLLAAAIGKMNGIQGLSGWRWIFILEGLLTCVLAIIFFFLISDFPEEAKWLSHEEAAYIKARLQADQGRSSHERGVSRKDLRDFFTKDIKCYLGGIMYFGLIVPAYSYAYFSPSIIQGYGYGQIQTQLHSVPPWAVAWGFALILAVLSDKTKHRWAWTIFPILVAVAGFAILLGVYRDTNTEYAALFLCAMGTYGALPQVICWFQANLGGHQRRAIGSAWQIGFGNIGGIIAVYVFLMKDAPRYIPGYSVCVAFAILSLVASCMYGFFCMADNKKHARMPTPVGSDALEQEAMKGDLGSHYRYML